MPKSSEAGQRDNFAALVYLFDRPEAAKVLDLVAAGQRAP
jgi:hypothetical protein